MKEPTGSLFFNCFEGDHGLTNVQGARKGDIRALAVSTDISPPASPCGMCRQFIREFCEVSCCLEAVWYSSLADCEVAKHTDIDV